jgi:GxxExxY protein
MSDTEWISPELNAIAKQVVDAAFQVHVGLGPGLLESVYEQCLAHELALRGLRHTKQNAIPLTYKGLSVPAGFRADLIVENKILLEIKSVETLMPVHKAQLMTYLRLTGCPIGYLMNFNVALFKDGIKRVILRPSHG